MNDHLESPAPSPAADHAEQCSAYRAGIEAAGAAGGVDKLTSAKYDRLAEAVAALGIDTATVQSDVELYTARAARVAAAERALAVVETKRPLAEIEADLAAASDELERQLVELLKPLRVLIDERGERFAADRALASAESSTVMPAEMSWAFFGLPKPLPPKTGKKRTMVGDVAVAEVLT